MGAPRKTKSTPIRYLASTGTRSSVVGSRKEAHDFVRGAKRQSIEPCYFKVRGWELDALRFAKPGEFEDLPDDWTGVRLTEREFTIKGADEEDLLRRAEARRTESYRRSLLLLLDDRNLRQLPIQSRSFARDIVAQYYAGLESDYDARVVDAEATAKVQAELEAHEAHLASIPTLGSLHDQRVKHLMRLGRVQPLTAENYEYECTPLNMEFEFQGERVRLWSRRVTEVNRKMIYAWFETYADTVNKFGKRPSAKTMLNVLTRLAQVHRQASRDDDLLPYLNNVRIDDLLEDVRAAKSDSDGWRQRYRLENEEVLKVMDAARTPLERAIVVLLLASGRPPSESCAARWSHLDEDMSGNLWWQVQSRVVVLKGGEQDLADNTKTGRDIDYRQLSIPRAMRPWLDEVRGRSPFILGNDNELMHPKRFEESVNDLLARAGVLRERVSQYSFRHTVGDEVDRLFGRASRNLVLHGKRERSTGEMHYSHATRDRRRGELMFEGKPYAEHFAWTHAF